MTAIESGLEMNDSGSWFELGIEVDMKAFSLLDQLQLTHIQDEAAEYRVGKRGVRSQKAISTLHRTANHPIHTRLAQIPLAVYSLHTLSSVRP